jgi:hypothetical protein
MNEHARLPWRQQWLRLGGALMISQLAAFALIFSSGTAAASDAPPTQAARAQLEEKLGIRIVGLRRSSAGYMLDFRYRVLDPAKAASLLDRKISPYLLDEATGAQLSVPDAPKVGQLRPTSRSNVIPGRNYYILFANPGRYLNAGSTVTLIAGDVRIRHLTVE